MTLKTTFASTLAVILFVGAGFVAMKPVEAATESNGKLAIESIAVDQVTTGDWEFTSRIAAARCRFGMSRR